MTVVHRAGIDRPTLYVVRSAPNGRVDLKTLAGGLGCDLREFASAEGFLDGYRREGPACLLIELSGSSLEGVAFLERLRKLDGHLPVVILAERGSVPMAVRAMRAGATSVIEKPYAPALLMREIRRLLDGRPSVS